MLIYGLTRADHQRRALFYRFNPGHAAYTPGVAEFVYPARPDKKVHRHNST